MTEIATLPWADMLTSVAILLAGVKIVAIIMGSLNERAKTRHETTKALLDALSRMNGVKIDTGRTGDNEYQ